MYTPSRATAKEFSISSFRRIFRTLPVLRLSTPTVPFWRPTNQIRPRQSGSADGTRSSGARCRLMFQSRTLRKPGLVRPPVSLTTQMCPLAVAITARSRLSR